MFRWFFLYKIKKWFTYNKKFIIHLSETCVKFKTYVDDSSNVVAPFNFSADKYVIIGTNLEMYSYVEKTEKVYVNE